jgi:hypothetical protein
LSWINVAILCASSLVGTLFSLQKRFGRRFLKVPKPAFLSLSLLDLVFAVSLYVLAFLGYSLIEGVAKFELTGYFVAIAVGLFISTNDRDLTVIERLSQIDLRTIPAIGWVLSALIDFFNELRGGIINNIDRSLNSMELVRISKIVTHFKDFQGLKSALCERISILMPEERKRTYRERVKEITTKYENEEEKKSALAQVLLELLSDEEAQKCCESNPGSEKRLSP